MNKKLITLSVLVISAPVKSPTDLSASTSNAFKVTLKDSPALNRKPKQSKNIFLKVGKMCSELFETQPDTLYNNKNKLNK